MDEQEKRERARAEMRRLDSVEAHSGLNKEADLSGKKYPLSMVIDEGEGIYLWLTIGDFSAGGVFPRKASFNQAIFALEGMAKSLRKHSMDNGL